MTLPVFTHPSMLAHQTGAGHPERSQRLTAVLDALDDASLDLQMREAPEASRAVLERVHPKFYLDAVFAAAPERGSVFLDPDTVLSPGSLEAGLRAAGAVVAAVEGVAEGAFDRAFCAVRPPGHHAEPDRAMGFCLFSTVAAAARAAQSLGLARVAVVDFDVH